MIDRINPLSPTDFIAGWIMGRNDPFTIMDLHEWLPDVDIAEIIVILHQLKKIEYIIEQGSMYNYIAYVINPDLV